MSPKPKKKPLTNIGWREWVTFPDFGGVRVKAKIDTGARTSAIHAWNLAIKPRGNTSIATFDLHPIQRDDITVVRCRAVIVDQRVVRDSGGHTERRCVIITKIQIGDQAWPIELTLTRRDEMGFRLLLGRTALRKRFIIDPGRSFLTSKFR